MTKTHINVISGSLNKKEWSEIIIDGKIGLPNVATRRGINLLVLNSELTPINFKFYDFNKYDVNQVFMDNIQNVPNHSIIILSIKGDGLKKMSQETKTFINTKLKSRFIMDLKRNNAWCCLIKKYDNVYKNIVEKADISIATINGFYDLSTSNTPVTQEVNYYYDPDMVANSPIKLKTYYLKKELNNIPKYDMPSRLRLLHNEYEGATCYIISCGPSINDYDPNLIRRIAGHNLVITIKQAYTKYPDITDFHLFNFCNLINYNYNVNPNVITGYMAQDDRIKGNYDLNFALLKEYQINKIRSQGEKFPPLSKRMNFEHFTMDKIVNRPEGPGIMYELGIYMAVHLGAREIVTLGWDVNYKHPKKIQTPNGQVSDTVNNSHFYGTNRHTQKNITKIVNENEFIISSSKILKLWLNLRNIELYLMSSLSKLDSSIPRIDPVKVYKYLTSQEIKLTNILNPIRQTENMDFINYYRIDSYKPIIDYIKRIKGEIVSLTDINTKAIDTKSNDDIKTNDTESNDNIETVNTTNNDISQVEDKEDNIEINNDKVEDKIDNNEEYYYDIDKIDELIKKKSNHKMIKTDIFKPKNKPKVIVDVRQRLILDNPDLSDNLNKEKTEEIQLSM